jgi:type I restriction enzyme M protein
MLDPQPGESIYDPAAGSGGMLVETINSVRAKGGDTRTLRLYGQEVNLTTSAIARMNLFLHGIEDFQIERGNTLSDPKLLEGDRLRRFDVILANPPYSIKQWDREAWASDPYGRNLYGVPPQGRADYAFFQHIVASMRASSGRSAILFPHGVLFRDEEQAMRAKLVEADVVECVLGLGPNLFYNSPMEACVVVCRARKPKERRSRILFINAAQEVTRERAQSFLEPKHIEKIVAAYRAFEDVDGFARVATVEEVRERNGNLSIARYVRSSAGAGAAKGPSLNVAIDQWIESSDSLRAAMDELFETLREVESGR